MLIAKSCFKVENAKTSKRMKFDDSVTSTKKCLTKTCRIEKSGEQAGDSDLDDPVLGIKGAKRDRTETKVRTKDRESLFAVGAEDNIESESGSDSDATDRGSVMTPDQQASSSTDAFRSPLDVMKQRLGNPLLRHHPSLPNSAGQNDIEDVTSKAVKIGGRGGGTKGGKTKRKPVEQYESSSMKQTMESIMMYDSLEGGSIISSPTRKKGRDLAEMVVRNLPKQEVNKEKKKQTNLSFSDELGRIFGEKCLTVADMKKEPLKPGQTSRNYVAQIPIKFFK